MLVGDRREALVSVPWKEPSRRAQVLVPYRTHTMRTELLLVFCIAACTQSSPDGGSSPGPASGDDAGGAAVVDGASPGQASSNGAYSVPVSDPSLSDSASFPVDVKVQQTSTGISLHYDLPQDLVGIPLQSVKLDVSATFATLTLNGSAGQATCAQTSTAIHCTESLPSALFDLSAVRAAAQAQGLSQAAADARVAVAALFSVDPIGILDVTLDTSGGDRGSPHGKGGP